MFALPDPADCPLQNGSPRLTRTAPETLVLLGRSGEEGDGSASEGLRKMLILIPESATLRPLWWPGIDTGQTARADLVTVFHATWALMVVANCF